MGTRERRERAREETRGKILDAARALFAAEGYDRVTMRRIAEAIEYSPTAIYLHFKDKETLIQELCTQDFHALAARFQEIASVADPIERLRRIGLAYIDFAASHPNHYRVMFMAASPHKPGDDLEALGKGNPQKDAYEFLRATVREAIASGRLAPEHRDADLIAQAAWASTHGVIALHLARGNDPWIDWRPMKTTAALVIGALIDGLLARGAAPNVPRRAKKGAR